MARNLRMNLISGLNRLSNCQRRFARRFCITRFEQWHIVYIAVRKRVTAVLRSRLLDRRPTTGAPGARHRITIRVRPIRSRLLTTTKTNAYLSVFILMDTQQWRASRHCWIYLTLTSIVSSRAALKRHPRLSHRHLRSHRRGPPANAACVPCALLAAHSF
jgi:hypothetical protein